MLHVLALRVANHNSFDLSLFAAPREHSAVVQCNSLDNYEMDGERGGGGRMQDTRAYCFVVSTARPGPVQSQDMVSFRTNDEALRLENFCFSSQTLTNYIFFNLKLDPLCHLMRQRAASFFPLELHWSRPAVHLFTQQMKMR